MAEPAYPAASKYQGAVAAGYEARRRAHPTWAWEQDQVDAFVGGRPGPRTVLDVPVGTGRYLPTYLAAGWRVHGADISADMVEQARDAVGDQISDCDLVVSPAEHLPFPDGSMDAIICGRFLQWLPDLDAVDAVVAELARVGRGELLMELRVPAAVVPDPSISGAARDVARAARRAVRRWRGRTAVSLIAHPEAGQLAAFDRHGWRLDAIGRACPFDPGLRFYRFERVTAPGRG